MCLSASSLHGERVQPRFSLSMKTFLQDAATMLHRRWLKLRHNVPKSSLSIFSHLAGPLSPLPPLKIFYRLLRHLPLHSTCSAFASPPFGREGSSHILPWESSLSPESFLRPPPPRRPFGPRGGGGREGVADFFLCTECCLRSFSSPLPPPPLESETFR